MINVEKVVRVLGYIVYTILWSPVIIAYIVIVPIIRLAMYIRYGLPLARCIATFKNQLIDSVKHDMEFIQTGKW